MKTKRWKYKLYIVLAFFPFINVLGSNNQTQVDDLYKNTFVTTPDMAQLIHNVKYPVNYSTGAVNISIPLYTVKSGDLELPIYLSYNSSGVKIDSPSGWVGQNWTLHAEPSIARNVLGHIDSKFQCKIDKKRLFSSDYGFTYVSDILSNNILSCNDSQPDQYCYDLGNTSGTFIYSILSDGNYGYMSYPFNDVKIEVNNPAKGDYFILYDNKGAIYKFDEYTDRSSSPCIYDTGWKASSIIAANGIDSVTFQYSDTYTRYTLMRHIDHYNVLDAYKAIGMDDQALASCFSSYYDALPYENQLHYEEQLQRPIITKTLDGKSYGYLQDGAYDRFKSNGYPYSEDNSFIATHGCSYTESRHLTAINFKGNQVLFISDNAAGGRLREIIVKNACKTVVKDILLDYFKSTTGRDFLVAIKYKACEDTITAYQFTYDHMNQCPESGNKSKDFWGYFNGEDNAGWNGQRTLVPRMVLDTKYMYKRYPTDQAGLTKQDSILIGSENSYNRAACEFYMKMGSLTSITYPTGVRDSFVFEANRVELEAPDWEDVSFHMSDHLQKLSGTDNIYYAGGLRIKEIFSVSNNAISNIRTFYYNDNGAGCSPINNNYNYFVLKTNKWYQNHDPQFGTWYAYCRCRNISSEPVIPITFSNGASVMYKNVTEYNGTKSDNIGYTTYTFDIPEKEKNGISASNVQDNSYLSANDFNEVCQKGGDYNIDNNQYSEHVWGDLLKECVYKKENSSYSLVKKTVNTYMHDHDLAFGKIETGKFYFKHIFTFDSEQETMYSPIQLQSDKVAYIQTFKLPKHYLSTSVTTEYLNEGSITTKTGYSYRNLPQTLPTSKTIESNEEYLREEYSYPLNNAGLYQAMASRNILSPVIKTTYYSKNAMDDKEMKTIVENHYQNVSESVDKPIYRPVSITYTYPDGSVQNRMEYLYDNQGKLVQATKDGTETETYIYGYNNQYVIGEVQNASFQSVSSILSSSFIQKISEADSISAADWNKLFTLKKLLPQSLVTFSQYSPLIGITKINYPNGTGWGFEYDKFGRLQKKCQISSDGVKRPVEEYEYNYKQ
jgi:hypothetical protein